MQMRKTFRSVLMGFRPSIRRPLRSASTRRRPEVLALEPRLLLTGDVPALNSLPGARVSLYLDFVGDLVPQWNQFTNITIPSFDQDGDPTTFSAGELSAITTIWQAVAEDYAPFNINVTTVPPPSFDNGVALKVDIGGNGAWAGGTPTGDSTVGCFMDSTPNVAFVFPANIGTYAPDIAALVSHEAGHGFGLVHQSVWDSSGNKVAEYNPGPGDGTAPIMGTPLAYWPRPISRWWYGTSDLSPSPTYDQDDMAIIAGTAPELTTETETGIGYRPAPTNMSAATAAPLAVSGSVVSGSGIIRLPSDVDYYSFATGAGQVSLSALVQTGINNLVPQLELFDSNGNHLIASAGPDANDDATITTTLAAGSYRLAVADSDGRYGNVGQYTISGTIVPTQLVKPPTDLVATAVSTSQVNLTWADNATNESGYRVDRSLDGVNWNTLTASLPADSTSYADTTAAAGTTYTYRVSAFNATLTSDDSNQATATTVPNAPGGLTATAVSSGQIDLTWSDVAGESGFQVERSTDGISWTQVGSCGTGVTSFADTTVAASATYSYRVLASDQGGCSDCSNVASATTPAASVPPAAPSGLVAVAFAKTSVTLSWNDNSGNESGFSIERSSNNGKSWSVIAKVGANVASFNDTSVSARKTYQYRIRAFNAAGYSPYSNVATVTTPQKGPQVLIVPARPPSSLRKGRRIVPPPAATVIEPNPGSVVIPMQPPGAHSGTRFDLIGLVLGRWANWPRRSGHAPR